MLPLLRMHDRLIICLVKGLKIKPLSFNIFLRRSFRPFRPGVVLRLWNQFFPCHLEDALEFVFIRGQEHLPFILRLLQTLEQPFWGLLVKLDLVADGPMLATHLSDHPVVHLLAFLMRLQIAGQVKRTIGCRLEPLVRFVALLHLLEPQIQSLWLHGGVERVRCLAKPFFERSLSHTVIERLVIIAN